MSQTTPNSSETLPVLPMRNVALLPYMFTPLAISRPASLAAVETALASEDKTLLVVAQRNSEADSPSADELHAVGTKAVIIRMARDEAVLQLLVQGTDRVRIERIESTEPYLTVRVQLIVVDEDNSDETEALQRSVTDLVGKMLQLAQPNRAMQLQAVLGQAEDALHLVFLVGSLLNLDVEQQQALLETTTRAAALRLIHEHLHHEVQVLELRNKIAEKTQGALSQEQREYMLRQQLKAIQEELGEVSPTDAEAAALREQLDQAQLPPRVREEADRELGKLQRLNPAAPDYQLMRTYLELICELPWQTSTTDSLDLDAAQRVLDEDHYGLADIKTRIVEHLAVMQLNPRGHAPILCFVGPPGVGKTSLGQSIARALGRHFERLSLGGMHDEAELRGHRRTYIGAMPGGVIQAIRRAGVNNPLLMLDEVDKLGRDFRGDPASALLEILDPAQNSTFRDNYLDLPFDLSKVFFITTANTTDSIPRPLLDRMELIRLAGYTQEEKLQIARRYLIPRRYHEAGLAPPAGSPPLRAEAIAQEKSSTESSVDENGAGSKPSAVPGPVIPDETLMQIISRYTREAGVRQLERAMGRIARKMAMHVAHGDSSPISIAPDELPKLLGKQVHRPETSRAALPAGVATGLAWTEVGGEVLYVEAVLLPDGKGLKLTGQLGDVMRESAEAAQSYLWSHADRLGIDAKLFRKAGVHLHVPAGAVPKDGPSAGVAMVTALASLYMNTPARGDTAMTGEITLAGQVLPIGGVKEKVLAARAAGIRRVILPRENADDLDDVPAEVRSELEFVVVDTVVEALAAAIPDLASVSPQTASA